MNSSKLSNTQNNINSSENSSNNSSENSSEKSNSQITNNDLKKTTVIESNKQTINNSEINLKSDITEKTEQTNIKFYIEIIFYPDNLPPIKSYYIMNQQEYDYLTSLHMDIYIEDFMNGENLTKDKLDIHVINNYKNIEIMSKFINLFENPFDIISFIKAKKSIQIIKPSNEYNQNFELSDHELNETESEKNGTKEKNETESDDYINTMTEIIESFNKTKKFDGTKLNKLLKEKPELKEDIVLSEITKKK